MTSVHRVGREREEALLRSFLDTMATGMAAAVIAGEEGIGKSTAWAETVAQAERRGYSVISYAGVESEQGIPHAALGVLVDQLSIGEREGAHASQLEALEAEIRATGAERSRVDRKLVSFGLLELLERRLCAGPVLVALDDAQWLDRASALALEFAIRRLANARLGVLVTIPGEERQVPLGLHGITPEERLRRVILHPFGVDEIDELLRARLGVGLCRPVLQRVRATARGNPLFALEIARFLGSDDHAVTHPLPIPESIVRRMEGRIRGLSAGSREVLLVAATLRDPTVQTIKGVLGERTLEGLSEAVDAAVIDVRADRVFFTHPILASVVYHAASPGRRRTVHHHLASVVADPADAARHRALATVGSDEAVAAALDDRARAALARGDTAAATELVDLALACVPSSRTREVLSTSLLAAQAHFAAGNTSRARTLLERAIADAPRGTERARALRFLGTVRYHCDDWRSGLHLLSVALVEAAGDERLACEVHCDVAWMQAMHGLLRQATSHATTAVERAERLEDDRPLADALTARAWVEALRGVGAPLESVRRAVQVAPWAPPIGLCPSPLITHGVILKWFDAFDHARLALLEARRYAIDRGEDHCLGSLLHHLAELECWTGSWRSAKEHAAEGCRMALQTGQNAVRCAALYALALVHAHLGEVDSARGAADQGLELAGSMGGPLGTMQHLGVLGFLDLSLGNLEGAARHLEPAWTLRTEVEVREPGVTRFAHDLVEVLIGLGRHDEAARVLHEWEEDGRRVDRRSVKPLAARLRGLLAAATGEGAVALKTLEDAVALHDGLQMPFELARTHLTTGEVRRRLKQKREARAHLGRALEIFTDLQAPLWAARARRELDRIGGRRANPSGLTPTEQRVAELVAKGGTNREVAELLFVSPKTIAGYLSHIFRKMGVRSRTELSRRLGEDQAEGEAGRDGPPEG